MKIIILIVSAFIFTEVNAQAQPKTFDKKDVIETLDRSELETDSDKTIKLENSNLQFEVPKIGLPIAEKATKNKTSNKAKIKPKVTKNVKPKKDKVRLVISKRVIQPSEIKKNDKFVFKEGLAYMYRSQKKQLVRYKIKFNVPLDSKGLRLNNNSYIVINKSILFDDIRAYKIKLKREKLISTNKALNEKYGIALTDDILKKRGNIEKKYNNGSVIKKSISLSQLHLNDEIYVVGDIQFVIRTSPNTSFKKKYWLIEKIDTNNISIKKSGKNRYKVSRFYKNNK